jgi:hypothetical protein
VSEPDARRLADAVATSELCRVAQRNRVELRLFDYQVTVKRDPTAAGHGVYEFTYRYVRPNPPFLTWTGHGMEFWVYVRASDGTWKMLPGQ